MQGSDIILMSEHIDIYLVYHVTPTETWLSISIICYKQQNSALHVSVMLLPLCCITAANIYAVSPGDVILNQAEEMQLLNSP